MNYVRLGMPIQELAFLGRWKSTVVLSYAEDALQSEPANRNLTNRGNSKGKKSEAAAEPSASKEKRQGHADGHEGKEARRGPGHHTAAQKAVGGVHGIQFSRESLA